MLGYDEPVGPTCVGNLLNPVALASKGAIPILSGAPVATASFGGDDDYDPAAGGTPELSVAALPEQKAPAGAVSFSGDDDYDPAAGGTPELSLHGLVKESAELVDCQPSVSCN